MQPSLIVAFWLVALLLIVVPGADWAFAISTGAGGGSVAPAVGGLVLGYAGITVVVAAGVGALVAGSPAVLTALTLVGGVYLVWHGAITIARPATAIGATGRTAARARGTLVQGIGVSALNPKGLLIFLALLPQFIDPQGAWPIALQIGVLGLAFTVTCAAFYLALGLLARTVLHTRPGAARVISRVAGTGMVVVGTVLLVERLV